VEIQKGSWPILPVFDVMQSLGDVDEMFRAFNMGIGMVFIVDEAKVSIVKGVLKDLTEVYEIGSVFRGNKNVTIT
jgi:phosphoribosylformylglycinamidine cyclo-ligase